MRTVRYGTAGVLFPPAELNTGAYQYYESEGYDLAVLFDQLCYTVPRAMWTPDIVPAAEHWDIDCFMDPFPLMALAANATSRIQIGLTGCDALRRVPAELAKTFLTLDHISKGRSFFALGAGEMKQFRPYGIEREKPFTRLAETVRIIKKLWAADGPIDDDGPIWKMHNAILGLRPYNDVPPQLLIAGGPGKSLEIAGRLADGWVTYLPPTGDADWYAEQVATVKRHAEQAGRDPEALRFSGCFMVIMHEDTGVVDAMTENLAQRWDAAATVPNGERWRRMGLTNPLGDDWSYARDLIPMDWARDDALRIAESVPPQAVLGMRLCGTARTVADQIQPYIEAGLQDVIVGNYAPLMMTGDPGGGMNGANTVMSDLFADLRVRNGQTVGARA